MNLSLFLNLAQRSVDTASDASRSRQGSLPRESMSPEHFQFGKDSAWKTAWEHAQQSELATWFTAPSPKAGGTTAHEASGAPLRSLAGKSPQRGQHLSNTADQVDLPDAPKLAVSTTSINQAGSDASISEAEGGGDSTSPLSAANQPAPAPAWSGPRSAGSGGEHPLAHAFQDGRDSTRLPQSAVLMPVYESKGFDAFMNTKQVGQFEPMPAAARPLNAYAGASGLPALSTWTPTMQGEFTPLPSLQISLKELPTETAQDMVERSSDASSVAPSRQPSNPSDSGADPVRLHVEWSEEGVRVWLGADADQALPIPQIAQQLRHWFANRGETLIAMICNGETVWHDKMESVERGASSSQVFLDHPVPARRRLQ